MPTTFSIAQIAWVLSLLSILGLGIYSTAIERCLLEVCEVKITLKNLPRSFSRFRIALISDVHLGFFFSTSKLSSVVEKINQLNPDIVCLTGDFLDSAASLRTLQSSISVLKKIKTPYGKYAVLGNHDYRAGAQQVINGLKQGEFEVLINNHVTIKKNQEQIYLAGLDDILLGKPAVHQIMNEIPEQACIILLVHEPDCADYLKNLTIELQLSGHSHGGQVRLPIIGQLVSTKLGKKYSSGLYKLEHLSLYTNKGLGTTILPIRFLCQPEITLIVLD